MMKIEGKNTENQQVTDGPKHIVVLDDEIDIAQPLADFFKGYDFRADFYINPLELLEQIKMNNVPDIILSDIKMPQIDGISLLKEIRKRNHTIPIVFISAHIDKDIILEAMEYGVSGFIEKPFHYANIISLVNNILKKQQAISLLNRSINVLFAQFKELDHYLEQNGKTALRDLLKDELENLIDQRNKLNELI